VFINDLLNTTINEVIYIGEVIMAGLSTGVVNTTMGTLIDAADAKVEAFMAAHTTDGTLSLSSSETLELQSLMASQAIASQTGTSTLKSIKDSVMASARNI
jgi:hypothetical protein